MKIEDVKKNLNKMIDYKGNTETYMLNACILKKNKDGFYYRAELLDVKANSLLNCRIEDVKAIEMA